MTQTLHKRTFLSRLLLLWATLLVAAGAQAQSTYESVTHSFADEALYGDKTPQLYFADLSATDVPAAATNLGLHIDFNSDIRLDFVYDATKVTGTNRPRTTGYYYANTRCLNLYGSATAANRVKLVFSSPSGATIKSVRIDGRADRKSGFATYAPSSTNSLVYVDGEVSNSENSTITYASTSNNYFIWEGSAATVSVENIKSTTWTLLSFTVEYEPDLTKAKTPAVTGDDAMFFTSRTVTIGGSNEGATYYYTTDGTTPTTESTKYTEPFVITETTTVKAIAVVDGLTNSGVATATFDKIPLRAGIADLTANATAATKEYVQLTGAVVTWVDGDSYVYIQDPSTSAGSGLRLIANPGALSEGDQVTGILQGSYSPARHELTSWSFLNDEVSVAEGGVAPAAEVELDVVANEAALVTSSVYTKLDYLNQRVRFVATANTVGNPYFGLTGKTVVNALTTDAKGVQIVLPAADLDVTVGGEYAFTGVIYENVVNAGGSRGFRTLNVAAASDITSPEGLALASLTLDRSYARLVEGEELQIYVVSQSHEAAISYESSDPSVVTVDESGKLTAVSAGTATIVVKLAANDEEGAAVQRVTVRVTAPAYQLANSTFTEWEHLQVTGGYYWDPQDYEGDEPEGWNGYVGLATNNSQLSKNDDGSVHLTDAVVENAHVPGLLTSASNYEVPLSASYSSNYNAAFAIDTEATAKEFTGLPDALEVVVKGSLTADNARAGAVLFTQGFKAYPDNLDADDRASLGTEGTTVATAENAAIASADEWQTLTIPFSYAVENQRPAFALVSIVTNATPATGTAADYLEDYLDVQSIRFVYNSELATASYDGADVEFVDGSATVDAAFNASLLALTTNGRAATIATAYDEATGVLTITVSGDDISANAENQHVYTIQFATAVVAEHEVIEGVAQINVSQYDDWYDETQDLGVLYSGNLTAEVQEGATTSITLKDVRYSVSMWGMSQTYGVGHITFDGLTVDEAGNIDASAVSVSIVDGELDLGDEGTWESALYTPYSATIVGTLIDGKLNATFTLVANYTEHDDWGDYTYQFTYVITFGSELPDFAYTRTVTAGNYGTITLNFTPEETTGIAQLYSIAGKKSDGEGNPLYLQLQEETAIQAGVPYIFLSDAAEITATALGSAESVTEPLNAELDWDIFDYVILNNGLQGTFEPVNTDELGEEDWYTEEFIPYNVYLLSNNTVVKAGANSSVGANRAYILMDEVPELEEGADIKGIRFYFNDSETSIQTTKATGDKTAIYNIAGQRLQQAQRGINIVGGKKVVIK